MRGDAIDGDDEIELADRRREIGKLGQLGREISHTAGEGAAGDLARARLIEAEEAHAIQQALLPRTSPLIHGFRVTGHSIPAGSVGGDWYDFIPLRDGRWGLVLADVSGKGTPGALIAAMLYASVSTLSSSSNSPEIVLGQVETTLRNQMGEGHYVTIFYGVLPFIATDLVRLVILIAFPILATFLPSRM